MVSLAPLRFLGPAGSGLAHSPRCRRGLRHHGLRPRRPPAPSLAAAPAPPRRHGSTHALPLLPWKRRGPRRVRGVSGRRTLQTCRGHRLTVEVISCPLSCCFSESSFVCVKYLCSVWRRPCLHGSLLGAVNEDGRTSSYSQCPSL